MFWKLITPTIQWRSEMTKTMTNTHIHKYTNQKCLKDPSCAIFFKSMGVKDIKYDIADNKSYILIDGVKRHSAEEPCSKRVGGRWIPRRLYCRWKLVLRWCGLNYGTTKSAAGRAKSWMAKISAFCQFVWLRWGWASSDEVTSSVE